MYTLNAMSISVKVSARCLHINVKTIVINLSLLLQIISYRIIQINFK